MNREVSGKQLWSNGWWCSYFGITRNCPYSDIGDYRTGLKLFDVKIKMSKMLHLGSSADEDTGEIYDYYCGEDFNLRINQRTQISEITITDPSQYNFIGNHLCSIVLGRGKFINGLMCGEWIFEMRNEWHQIVCRLSGGYKDGLKIGLWKAKFGSRTNFFNLRDDEFHGDIIITDTERSQVLYDYREGVRVDCRVLPR